MLVARKLVKEECIYATHNEHPVFHFSVEERCARTGVRRFTEKVPPSCFGCGGAHTNSGKSLFGCSECEFHKECLIGLRSDAGD